MDESHEIIYTVFCKTQESQESNEHFNFNLLKRAFKNKYYAYEYATSKITDMLECIYTEYSNGMHNQQRILPIHAVCIYTLYKRRNLLDDKYEYFLSEYKNFFRGVNFPVTMFFISEHTLS